MNAALVFMLIVIIFLAYTTFKYYISAAVFSAWIVEKKYAPPTDEEVARLTKWVMQKTFEKRH